MKASLCRRFSIHMMRLALEPSHDPKTAHRESNETHRVRFTFCLTFCTTRGLRHRVWVMPHR